MKKACSHVLGLRQRKALLGLCCCIPTLAGVLCLYLFPFLLALWRSLHQGLNGPFVGLQNYRELLCNAAFRLAVQNTLLFWGVALPLQLALGLFAALLCQALCARRQKALLFLPAMVPAACAALLVQSLFPVASLGPQAAFGLQVGLFLWKNSGYTVLLLSAALQGIPPALLEAAALCGASKRQIFWHIQLPLILPAVGASLLVAFLNSFKIFRESYLLWGAHPALSLYGIPHFFYNNFANMDHPRLAAASVLLAAVIAGGCAAAWQAVQRKGALPDETLS